MLYLFGCTPLSGKEVLQVKNLLRDFALAVLASVVANFIYTWLVSL